MSPHRRHPTLLIAAIASLALLLAGCSATTDALPAQSSSTPSAPASASPAPTATNTPLPAAKMICSDETQGNVAKILSIEHPTKPESNWANDVYTCTYRVPSGTLKLSVKQSQDDATARAYFDAQQKAADSTEPIEGLANLGLPAYQTPDGKVSFVKDNMTLLVDGSQLSSDNASTPSRTHLAYQVATAILGCWSE